MKLPQSVPGHLTEADAAFWLPLSSDFAWGDLDLNTAYAISGAAFIDLSDPYGPLGNPFAVVIGKPVKDFDNGRCQQITQLTRTPETVFIRDCHSTNQNEYELLLTVLTPTGKELGACAHGFTGAVQTILAFGLVAPGSEIHVRTTLDTTAKVFVSAAGVIALEFVVQEQRMLTVSSQTINDIFHAEVLSQTQELPVLSVGSPKLTIEVSIERFAAIQRKLGDLDYDQLLAFEDKEKINGVHIYCRNPRSRLPEKAIQVNAYLGKDNVVDPATGVSAAGQISADDLVPEGTEVTITQYTARGPSAILKVTKQTDTVRVGGTAVLFNYKELENA